jgi:hypothetical protein
MKSCGLNSGQADRSPVRQRGDKRAVLGYGLHHSVMIQPP